MKKLNILAMGLMLLTACNHTVQAETKTEVKKEQLISIPQETSQLLVVTTENWSTKDGTLQRYEKEDKQWKKIGKSIQVVVGRNGLSWGKGLHTTPKDAKYIKKEGDGKGPAGLFSIKNAFGYASAPFTVNFPYSVYKTTDHCVDDSNSKWYNQIIDSTKVEKDYKSFEHMKLKNNLYKYGLVVNHNPEQIAQAGSCIFMHIKSPSGKGTAGCTAMREEEITKVLQWLMEKKKPLLLQLPKVEMSKIDFL
jgi:D-alanyl-D-alanine dipeptidase